MKSRIAALALAGMAGQAGAGGDVGRGAYLANIMHCNGCHSVRNADGSFAEGGFLAGGTVGFEIPGLGIFWPPNLTSDPTGLGDWSDDEILHALREGVRPDGRMLAPAMPVNDYHVISDADAADLIAYLRSLPPVVHAVPEPVGTSAEATAPFYRVVPPK